MSNWFETPLGICVTGAEAKLARSVLDDVFGFDLLQIGEWGQGRFLLESARTQNATLLADGLLPGVGICTHLNALPLRADSIDALLLPHTLERIDDPYALLREAERVLRPDGSIIICGFNPWSGWGLRRGIAHAFGAPEFPPGTLRMISELRLRDWVALLGFEVEQVSGYLGMLPLAGGMNSGRNRLTRPAIACGAYFLKARKRVPTLTMLRPKWRSRRRVLVGAAEPTTRVRG